LQETDYYERQLKEIEKYDDEFAVGEAERNGVELLQGSQTFNH
jgi:hypothetical protein